MSEYQLWVVFNYECWNCHKELKVALNVSDTLDDYFSNDEIGGGGGGRMFSDESIDPDIRKVLESHGCHLDIMYSKTVGGSYMANFLSVLQVNPGRIFPQGFVHGIDLYGPFGIPLIQG